MDHCEKKSLYNCERYLQLVKVVILLDDAIEVCEKYDSLLHSPFLYRAIATLIPLKIL